MTKVGRAARVLPMGVEIHTPIDLQHYLPYRLHKLAAMIASPNLVDLPVIHGFSTRAWRVMMVIATEGPLALSEIAKHIAADAASTTRAVQILVKLNYAITRTPKSDRRKQVVTLTQCGAALHDKIAQIRLADEESMMSALAPGEREMLFRLIDKLQAQATKMRVDEDDPFDPAD